MAEAGLLSTLASYAGDAVSTLNPLYWFQQGQARDEARGVRAGDIEREEKWLERNSVTGRIREGMRNGLSLTAAAGMQPGMSSSTHAGQDTAHLNNMQGISPTSHLEKKLLEAQIRSVELDNLKKGQELEPTDKPGKPVAGDGFLPGSSQSIKGGKRILESPMERTTSYPGQPHMEPGAINTLGYSVTNTGLMPIPSKDVKERIEDSPYEWSHFYRYGVTPGFGGRSGEPPLKEMQKAFPGSIGSVWDPVMLEWIPKYPRGGERFPLGPVPRWFYNQHKAYKQRMKGSNNYPEGHLFHRKGRR